MNIIYGLFILIATYLKSTESKDTHKVQCSEDLMQVHIILPQETDDVPNIYLEGMKGYPNPHCKPVLSEKIAQFKLPLTDFYECGVTRVVNKLTGRKVFYHKIIIESTNNKEFVSVKCITTAPTYNATRNTHGLTKRDVLPAGFEEPIDLDITTSLEERAPDPILGIGVRQGGEIVSGELNVSPGTPLSMEIYLDKASAPVYGLGVTYMQVTDTKSQEETIIFNGCSVDPYLFENFNTVDGDFLTAKFRAFKFPDSTYVQFRGTVNVCVDKCKGVQCSNGQIGYGRRKREIAQSADPNKVYEISMTTFIHVDGDPKDIDKSTLDDLEQKLRQLKFANQKLERNSRGSVFEGIHDHKAYVQRASGSDAIVEETTLIRSKNPATSATTSNNIIFHSLPIVIAMCVIKLIL